ncbi:MAG: hypothetical protein ACTSQJ_13760 [Promethearchaeota archaeon]
MNSIIPTLLISGYIFILCISMYTIIHIFRFREKYGTNLNAFLNISIILVTGVIYSSLFVFSIIFFFSESINLILWKLSLISGFLSLGITLIIHNFILEYKKIQVFPFITFLVLLGFLIGLLYSPYSIEIVVEFSNSSFHYIDNSSEINFTYSFLVRIIISLLQILILIYFYYISFKVYINARDKKISKVLIFNSIVFTFPIIMYILYTCFPIYIFREFHIFSLWFVFACVCLMLIKKPQIFLVMTNKIYAIQIYHKSGILLYSYKFESKNNKIKKKPNDSAIWGNILIGINHILSEFVDNKDQIDVFQTKNADIIVDYNDKYGFAVLVITDLKNDILKKFMRNFSLEFQNKYKNELLEIQDLNKIINVSEFKDTKEMIEKNFHIYI